MDQDRSRFEHLYVELSVACEQLVPRYRLWLALREAGADPETLQRKHALSFCDAGLEDFLRENGMPLSGWKLYKVRRAVLFFDPSVTSPAELMERLDGENA